MPWINISSEPGFLIVLLIRSPHSSTGLSSILSLTNCSLLLGKFIGTLSCVRNSWWMLFLLLLELSYIYESLLYLKYKSFN